MRRVSIFADERGIGAIEFAILAPILILVVFGMIVGAAYAAQLLDTRAAVQAGAKYVIQGGSDSSAIRTVALSAWANKPTGGTVEVSRYCVCGSVVSACAALCGATNKAPEAYVQIEASSTWSSPLQNSWLPSGADVSQKQVIRVR
jgi:Flp pilus assembly protein TadG